MSGSAHKAGAFFSAGAKALRRYRRLREEEPLDDNAVLLEQQRGLTANGNLFYIARELCSNPAYGKLQVFFSADPAHLDGIAGELRLRGVNAIVIERKSNEYYRLLACARYLVCDTSLPPEFAKRPGQVLLNTWHGTPLKTLGRRIPGEAHLIGNVETCFLAADFLLYPNEFTAEKLSEDYMFAGLSQAIDLLGGYPRNAVLCADERTDGGQRTYAYLPTFRSAHDEQLQRQSAAEAASHLAEIDALLEDDEVMYAQLHPTETAHIDFGTFRHVQPFPDDEETYEVLARCDALATDYSSVMFDFAVTGRTVVLFTYDEERYLMGRGLYFGLDELPFSRVDNAADLVGALRKPKGYDDAGLRDRFCPFDSPAATTDLCRRVFLKDNAALSQRQRAKTRTALVWIRRGQPNEEAWRKALDTAHELSATHKTLVAFPARMALEHPERIDSIPEDLSFLAYPVKRMYFARESVARALARAGLMGKRRFARLMRNYRLFEQQRLFGTIPFDEIASF